MQIWILNITQIRLMRICIAVSMVSKVSNKQHVKNYMALVHDFKRASLQDNLQKYY